MRGCCVRLEPQERLRAPGAGEPGVILEILADRAKSQREITRVRPCAHDCGFSQNARQGRLTGLCRARSYRKLS